MSSSIDFKFHPYRARLAVPYAWGLGVHTHGKGVIVQCTNPRTLKSGWAEIAFEPDSSEDPDALAAEARAFVSGWDPAPCEKGTFREQLDRTEHFRPRNRIRCGVVNAWLAQGAGELNIRLGELFGRKAKEIVPVNGFVGTVSIEKTLELCGVYAKLGISVVKLKGGTDVAADVKRLQAIRESFPGMRLRIDPNGCWQYKQLRTWRQSLVDLQLEYLEEPFHISSSDYKTWASEFSALPLALDHWGTDVSELAILLAELPVQAVILKQQILGGFDKGLEILEFLEASGVLPVVTCSLETLVGISLAGELAAIQKTATASGLMLWNKYQPNVLTCPEVKEGSLGVPLHPGGVEPLLDVLHSQEKIVQSH